MRCNFSLVCYFSWCPSGSITLLFLLILFFSGLIPNCILYSQLPFPFTLRRPNLVGPPFACPNIQARTHNPALITFPFRVRGSARAPVSNTTPYPREARTARSSSRSHHDLISARASVEYQLVERVWVTATRTLRAAGTWVDRNHRLCLDHAQGRRARSGR